MINKRIKDNKGFVEKNTYIKKPFRFVFERNARAYFFMPIFL